MTRSIVLAILLAACASDSEVAAPSAPANLTVVPLGGGAHLTWNDTSDDEDGFAIMRQEMGVDGDMVEIATVPFDSEQFHDEPLTQGATYLYQVLASNDGGDAASGTVTFVTP